MRDLWKCLGVGVALLTTVLAGCANAQAVKQSGAVVPFHDASWYSNGVIGDGGTPQSPFHNALGLFGGANCPLGVSSQTEPGASTSQYGLLTICQTKTATTFTVAGVNGLATPSVFFNIGGVSYPFPGTGGGGVVGPVSSVSGNFACWNGTTGSTLSDCGIASSAAANTFLGNATASTAPMAAIAIPNCNASNSALNWTAGVGFSCRSISGGGGGVTSVATGAGLVGGPITSSGTISATTTLNAQVGTTYTVQIADSAGAVTLSNSSAIAVVLPQPTGSFGAGFATTICDVGSGTATLTPTASTIGGNASYILTQGNCVTPISDGSNYQALPSSSTFYGLRLGSAATLLCSIAAPTVTSAGTSPSVTDNNGSCSFAVNVGTGGSASAVVLGLPTAVTGWTCAASDVTTQSTSVFLQKQTASSASAATITNYNASGAATAFVASDKLRVSCHAD